MEYPVRKLRRHAAYEILPALFCAATGCGSYPDERSHDEPVELTEETLGGSRGTRCYIENPYRCSGVSAKVLLDLDIRTIDGSSNNLSNPEWGTPNQPFVRKSEADYADGKSAPAGAGRPSARVISNQVCAQSGSIENDRRASDMVWQFGQFLDHDLDLTPIVVPFEHFNIPVPKGDPVFDPGATGEAVVPFERSAYAAGFPRQQINVITAYIDGSNVYGSDDVRAAALRTHDGTGRLRTSEGDLLPYNTDGLPNASLVPNDPTMFLAGDFRANEQVGLAALHTLFVREHNYLAELAGEAFPKADDEQRYQMARGIVAAELQHITFEEFVPVLIGRSLPSYSGYKSSVNAQVDNAFATASYRFGHSMLSPSLLLASGQENSALPLAQAFFNPEPIETSGIDPLIRGLVLQKAQRVDPFIVDGVRNFLFGPGAGLDLASLNIQRGRDHGIASYNDLREAYGLSRKSSLSDISLDPLIRQRLKDTYDSVDDVDAWVGGLAEDHVSGALVGPLVAAVLEDQFRRARDGDRFYYETYLPASMVDWVKRQSLADIIKRNTSIGSEIGSNAFKTP